MVRRWRSWFRAGRGLSRPTRPTAQRLECGRYETSNNLRRYFVLWAGQLVSLTGSAVTSFALAVWVFQETGSATQLSIIYLATMLPNILISIPAGTLADRWNRKAVMIISDAGSGLTTLIVLVLVVTGGLEVWHVYLLTVFNAAFGAFQTPAYLSAISTLVPKDMLNRVSGLTQLGRAGPVIVAPLVAGFALSSAGLQGVLLIDLATFLFALATLLVIRIPLANQGGEEHTSFVRELTTGFVYIERRPGLMGLLVFFAVFNLLVGVIQVLFTPLVLSFASVETLGFVLSVAGLGMLAGSVLLSVWGGPERRVFGILGFAAVAGVALAVFGLRPLVPLMAAAGFVAFFARPFFDGLYQALTQAKVAAEVQGRVFALQQAVMYSTLPISYLLAGPLADNIFEPLLVEGGALAASAGAVIGVGSGRGIGLMFILVGLGIAFAAAVTALSPRVRRVDLELPDALPDSVEARGREPNRGLPNLPALDTT